MKYPHKAFLDVLKGTRTLGDDPTLYTLHTGRTDERSHHQNRKTFHHQMLQQTCSEQFVDLKIIFSIKAKGLDLKISTRSVLTGDSLADSK